MLSLYGDEGHVSMVPECMLMCYNGPRWRVVVLEPGAACRFSAIMKIVGVQWKVSVERKYGRQQPARVNKKESGE